ncbi:MULTISPECIES: DUF1059 domain-containing protein [Vogesella]|jgi:predicted small metal-binding protein|uniref:DUF1059 domain-containing protein n=1 Tax=Vogesella indigofera TaxID=45465 RepID=A0A495AW84_VOGIN|nr:MULTISPECIES: DUF1059 domain-containing protein [Vogesella]MCQ4145396.1 DUF1059 domain-containing protein [Vogesella sp. AC12]MDC7689208.1 DUF1059 domain-containing protein [Vogesella indigofera]MDC7697243.1 DUF1059 domain-containing protein [Vogesella indigofera]MDC7701331.1 DUF1059 domain-containing protein [Vogesella indigofera]MDC7702818.1 DUF1059 domain-containing protein [Vogesella indigofera]
MARKLIDCREHSGSPPQCTVSIAADSEDELLAAAVQHAVTVHGYPDTPEMREQLRQMFKDEPAAH